MGQGDALDSHACVRGVLTMNNNTKNTHLSYVVFYAFGNCSFNFMNSSFMRGICNYIDAHACIHANIHYVYMNNRFANNALMYHGPTF